MALCSGGGWDKSKDHNKHYAREITIQDHRPKEVTTYD